MNHRETDEVDFLVLRAGDPKVVHELLFLDQGEIQSRLFYLGHQKPAYSWPSKSSCAFWHPARVSEMAVLQEATLINFPVPTDLD